MAASMRSRICWAAKFMLDSSVIVKPRKLSGARSLLPAADVGMQSHTCQRRVHTSTCRLQDIDTPENLLKYRYKSLGIDRWNPPDIDPTSVEEHPAILEKVKEEMVSPDVGRLFAVVQVAGKQFKVTTEDLVLVQQEMFADPGERVRLEKVLLVGGNNFTLIGKPILSRDQVRIEATVIEKFMALPLVVYKFKKRKGYRKRRDHSQPCTVLRINSIEVAPNLN
ncbi:large ribosomal subunit protein bL21m-like isoform X2 [Branchiostoma lanceolatum]|uniref:large ribosomal subunit protein bL21m-like isoform X2 n=1 Tax=Branchiostoma lanceolatum TaxID=7740 RepID=UPI003455F5B7